eukprot:TRINITY_DN45296_c0_g2_i2.p2 TRINITY_DN45296_c0_g2~~TRINITY_DN45296_c0_g2_i2.p2  ORF type:complete len:637 (-),score=218.97 TRINITY_DN45296_c0_g2_i2:2109-3998(-)
MKKGKSGGKGQPLGRALEKARNKAKAAPPQGKHTLRHVSDVLGAKPSQVENSKLDSIVERSDLEEFLDTALMSQKNFAAARGEAVVVGNVGDPMIISASDLNDTGVFTELYEYETVPIPRRPHWDSETSAEELQQHERDAFLEWRRIVAQLEEQSKLAMTPFEKNLDVWRQLWRVVERSDVVVQIVDARNPLLFRCKDLEKYVHEVDPTKKMLLLVNKSDLLSSRMRERWAEYFKSQGITFAFCSAMEDQVRQKEEYEQENQAPPVNSHPAYGDGGDYDDDEEEEELKEDEEAAAAAAAVDKNEDEAHEAEEDEDEEEADFDLATYDGTEVLSTKQLLQVFRKLYLSEDNKDDPEVTITVGMVGYPNVGKSSMINALCGEKKVGVAAMPGKTRHFQTIVLGNITLCDCPGLVFPTFMNTKAGLLCNGILPIDRMRDHIPPVRWICCRVSAEQLETTYNFKLPEQPPELSMVVPSLISHHGGTAVDARLFLESYAQKRGFFASNGRPDDSRSARVVLKDFTSGKLLYCHPPPHLTEDERIEFFNSLQKTSVMFREILTVDEASKKFDAAAQKDNVLKDVVRETEKKNFEGTKKLTRKERARLKAHARAGMDGQPKFRRVQGIFFGASNDG